MNKEELTELKEKIKGFYEVSLCISDVKVSYAAFEDVIDQQMRKERINKRQESELRMFNKAQHNIAMEKVKNRWKEVNE